MNRRVALTDLLDKVSRLEKGEFDAFFHEMLSLRATRVAPVLPQEESVLLQKIYLKLPKRTQQRYEALSAKRKSGGIQTDEYAELLKLVSVVEKHNVERLNAIVELAGQRRITPQELMKQLGLMPLHNG